MLKRIQILLLGSFFVTLFACSAAPDVPVTDGVSNNEAGKYIPTGRSIVVLNEHGIISPRKAPLTRAERNFWDAQSFEKQILAAASDQPGPDQNFFLGKGPDFGGQLVYVDAFNWVLARHQNHVVLITPSVDNQRHEYKDPDLDLTIVRLPLGDTGYKNKYEIIPYFNKLAEDAADYLKDVPIDLVVSNFYDATTVADEMLRILDRPGVPLIANTHSLGLLKTAKNSDEDLWGYTKGDDVDLTCVRNEFIAELQQYVRTATEGNQSYLVERPATPHGWMSRPTLDPKKLIQYINPTASPSSSCASSPQKVQEFKTRLVHEMVSYADASYAGYVVINDENHRGLLERVNATPNNILAPAPFLGYSPENFFPKDDSCNPSADERRRTELLRELNLDPDLKYVVFAGRPAGNKGVFAFINAMEDLWRKDPILKQSIRGLMITGTSQDPIVKQIEDMIRAKGLTDMIYRVNGEPNYALAEMLRLIPEVIVFPSIAEPFGLLQIEEMVTGIPVVASRNSGASQYFLRECPTCLLLMDPSNTDDFANTISYAIHARPAALTIARKGADFVQRVFTWEKAINAFFKDIELPTIQELCKKHSEATSGGSPQCVARKNGNQLQSPGMNSAASTP